MIVCLTSYLCKPEHTLSELIEKICHEVQGQRMMQQLSAISSMFLTKREVYWSKKKTELEL